MTDLAWTAVGVAGAACLVAAGVLLGGVAAGLIVAGLALLAAAIDGRR